VPSRQDPSKAVLVEKVLGHPEYAQMAAGAALGTALMVPTSIRLLDGGPMITVYGPDSKRLGYLYPEAKYTFDHVVRTFLPNLSLTLPLGEVKADVKQWFSPVLTVRTYVPWPEFFPGSPSDDARVQAATPTILAMVGGSGAAMGALGVLLVRALLGAGRYATQRFNDVVPG